MKTPRFALSFVPTLLAVVATVSALGCADGGSTRPDALDVRFDKPSCPGHPSCGDPPAPAGNATVELSGGVTTTSEQPVVLGKDSKNQLSGSGGGEDFTMEDALSLFVAAGSPTPTARGDCVADPPDLEDAVVGELIDHLTDGSRRRTFRFAINRKDPANMTGGINQSWDDDAGDQYRTRVTGAVVTSPSEGLYVYTVGSIVSWNMSTNDKLVCPNGGSVTMTLDR